MKFFSDIEFFRCGVRENVSNFHTGTTFPYFGLQFFSRGEFSLQINGGKIFTGNTPVIFITAPGFVYSYGSLSGKLRNHSFCCFNGPRVERYLESGLLPTDLENPFIPIYDHKFFQEKFHLLERELRMPDIFHHAKGVLLLEEILVALQEEISHSSCKGKSHWFSLRELQEKVSVCPEKDWNFEEEAKKLSLSYSLLRSLYKEMTGRSPWNYLLQCRLRKGEELLLSTSLRINEVAHRCGFEDEFHFSRFFRQNKGLSPSRFREHYRKTDGDSSL